MIRFHSVGTTADYNQERYDMLVLLEGKTTLPYADTVGVATIGIGYNLRVNLEPVLRAMVGNGHYSQTLFNRLDAVVDKHWSSNSALRNALDDVMANWKATRDSGVPATFTLATDQKIKAVMVAIAPNYDAMIDNWLAGIPDSRERAALFSLTWNAPSLLGPKLKAAIENGNRAEAWYEIRYNSNGSGSDGIANRRYVEAHEFGLYDSPGTASRGEALKAGAMAAIHRDKILSYEAAHDADAAGALKGIPAIDAIADELRPAMTALKLAFGIASGRLVEDLQVASATLANLAGDGTARDNTGNDNDFLIGHGGNNRLSGGAAGDTFVGLGGADTLTGGRGADLFVFTAISQSSRLAADRITDFNPGEDRIALNAIDADGAGGDTAFTFRTGEGSAFTGQAGELRYRFLGSDTRLEGDVDGDRVADLVIILSGHRDLTAADLLL